MTTIPYGRQTIEPEDVEAVNQVLNSLLLTQGPVVLQFETAITDFLKKITHSKNEIYASAVNNGTTALHMACLALGLKSGDRVLVTSNSFVASANCVLYCGAEVEFVDISAEDFCIDLTQVENILEASPKGTFKGIIAVDFAGFVFDCERLRTIADRNGLWIIEDSCHAIGGTRKAADGSVYAAGDARFANISVYSFHPVKHIATGEGGMILTQSKKLDDRIKLLRTHGITKDAAKMSRYDGGWYYEMQDLGYNGRISDILCALGVSQMKRIDRNLARRRAIAKRYHEELKGLPLTLPLTHPGVEHAYHLFIVQTEKRKELYDYLASKKIVAQVHYIPIHQMRFYVEKYGAMVRNNCDRYYQRCLSIPMYHGLTDEDQTRVISELQTFFKNCT